MPQEEVPPGARMSWKSWIVRWMGGRSNEAMSDFRKGAEVEADRYSQECLYALRDDVVTLLSESD